MEWYFDSLGILSMAYWQGAGVAYTDWDDVYTGVGSTEQGAALDALDMLCQSANPCPDDIARMEFVAMQYDGDTLVCQDCEYMEECDQDKDVECDNTFVVLLYTRGMK